MLMREAAVAAGSSERVREAALGLAMWEHGMRPKDLNADAAAALDAFAGPVAVAHAAALGTPKSKILEMTEAAGKISFSKIRAGVERRKAEIKRRSSLGLDNASTELASLRASRTASASASRSTCTRAAHVSTPRGGNACSQ